MLERYPARNFFTSCSFVVLLKASPWHWLCYKLPVAQEDIGTPVPVSAIVSSILFISGAFSRACSIYSICRWTLQHILTCLCPLLAFRSKLWLRGVCHRGHCWGSQREQLAFEPVFPAHRPCLVHREQKDRKRFCWDFSFWLVKRKETDMFDDLKDLFQPKWFCVTISLCQTVSSNIDGVTHVCQTAGKSVCGSPVLISWRKGSPSWWQSL